jgi:hypothetical protein
VALIVARKASKRIGIDTATWMPGRDDTD